MKNKIALIGLLVLASTGAGCSWFHGNTRDTRWEGAQQEPPLQVPPDLEKPSNAAALSIPDLSTPAGAAAPMASPPNVQGAPMQADGAQAVGRGLLVFNDTVDSVYRRVGLALRRGDIGRLLHEEPAMHSYEVQVSVTEVEKPQGFFSRIFSHETKRTVRAAVAVHVVADGNKARVELQGPEAAVSQLQAALQQRLG